MIWYDIIESYDQVISFHIIINSQLFNWNTKTRNSNQKQKAIQHSSTWNGLSPLTSTCFIADEIRPDPPFAERLWANVITFWIIVACAIGFDDAYSIQLIIVPN